MKKGKIISLEGTDFSGKNTQAKLLVDKLSLNGHKSQIISFPRYGTPTGDIVGDCYLGKNNRIKTGSWFEDPTNLDPKLSCLYYAGDRRAAISEIIEKRKNGINLIFDRYVESNMGHQCGKLEDEKERKELSCWIEKLEYDMLELPRPDLVIFLYMPFQIAQKLKEGRKDMQDVHESSENHLRNAENAYLELAERYNWKKILCSKNSEPRCKDEIHEKIFSYVSELLNG